ncbi:hypothetical protein EI94DRAFT_1720434 [Lactarius quietus]|nr:hypothetical protein EI94DRAFT_1720434 [Lactarius quietus]
MDITPIPLYTIKLILQYICPPSQLISPIPSDLLSLSLLQRHRRDRAIQHLESLPMALDELAPDFLVGYAADPEHAYAHVHVKSTGDDGLRLVFEWDGQESWKYHDANVMPFPPGAHHSLSDAVASASTITIPTPELKGPKLENLGNGDGDDDANDDDDYWNSYGAEGTCSVQPSPFMGRDEVDATEDAYWAQYASVQGSADSTVPSPVHKTTRKLLTVETLSPRPEDDIPDATDDDTESSSLETPWETGTMEKSHEDLVSSSPAFKKITNLSSHQGIDRDDDGLAVQDAVRGLFWLWKTTRRGESSSSEEHDRADFLQLVGRAIEVPK